ncbi:MAG: TolB family protein, partial [Candidatus Aminicenantales bacterium]
MKLKTKTILCLILTLFFSVFMLSASSKKPFTVNDMLNLVSVASPQISPDGSRILFTKSKPNWSENKQEKYLWLVSADGKEIFKFTNQEGDSSPQWSPDGQYLAFLRGKGDKRQIWLMRSSGGEAVQVSHHESAISAFKWFPDSQHILFAAPDIKT